MDRLLAGLRARLARAGTGDRGFTLIELLVVVIIIGVLAAIAVPIYIGVQNSSRDSAVESDLGNAKNAVVISIQQSATNSSPASMAVLPASDYMPSGAANYGTTPTITVASDGKSFCIAAVAVTGSKFAASDNAPVAKGTCSTAGKFVAGS